MSETEQNAGPDPERPERAGPYLRFHFDKALGLDHIAKHNVQRSEVEEVLSDAWEVFPGKDNASVALGPTNAGRFLQVVFVEEGAPGHCFVVTAFPMKPKQIESLKRRRMERN